MEKPTSDEIVTAITTSGYLMEQELATRLESLGFHVETSRAYRDLDEAKSREIDVWAIQRLHYDDQSRIAVFVELICECKNSSNPFVFLRRKKNQRDQSMVPQEYVFPNQKYEVPILGKPNSFSVTSAFEYLNLAKENYRFQGETKAVQFAKIVRDKNKWEANHAGMYDAIFYPLVKALLSRQQELPKSGEYRYVWLFFPLLVTSGELYAMDSAAVPLKAEPVDHVAMRRHIKSRTIDGEFNVDFVTQSKVPEFITSKVIPFSTTIMQRAKENPQLFHPNPFANSQ